MDIVAVAESASKESLPHSVEAEQAVLGGLMLDNKRIDAVAETIGATPNLHPYGPRRYP